MDEDNEITKEEDQSLDDPDNQQGDESIDRSLKRSRILRPQTVQSKKFCAKDERNASIKKVSVILQKCETERTSEESQVLTECSDAVEEVQSRWRRRDEAKRRVEEFEEPDDVLREKCLILAQAIAQSQHLVVYTGAGISTAAKIPDYRGPNGIWTRLQQGKDIGDHDLSLAEPTFTHMSLFELYRKKILKYIVSQNCDGLHLRSGLPRTVLSELHGNMYIEVCKTCKPHKEYWRLFDVTENTARYSHKTCRKCYACNAPLVDTIVHFGERGQLQWPLNWAGACQNAENATTILCLGSSLKVLKKYPWLWQMDKPAKKRPNLYIVNLQWTPKDDVANVKINGKCDHVMAIIMRLLDIEVRAYDKGKDPIFGHCTLLHDDEMHTSRQPLLKSEQIAGFSDNDLSLAKKTAYCDRSSNSNNVNSPPSAGNSNFSIDGILQKPMINPHLPQLSAPTNQTLSNKLTFSSNRFLGYDFANFFQYGQLFGAYPELIYYPFQTSFLYPGLHNIIAPPNLTNQQSIVALKQEANCHFCEENYGSLVCLFYAKSEAIFVDLKYRFSKLERKDKPNVCVCCDYSTDEGDLSETNESGSENNKDLVGKNIAKIQAGWFGKGCKKNRRVKKK